MKSRQSNKSPAKKKKAKKAVWQTSVTSSSSAGRTARESNLFATGIVGKYGFWRNNYLGLLALIFKQKGRPSRKQLAALTDSNDRAWVIQLDLLLQSLQHPESAPLITKQQTIRQIEQLMTNAGYKIPAAQAISYRTSSPSDATSAHLQAQRPAEKPVKKRGRKSKKRLEAESSVNHMNHPEMTPESPSEKRVRPAFINHVNKGNLPLINRSIGQIAASIGMVGSSRRSMPEQQSQTVSRHQHTTQNVNIQLKNIQLFHRNVIREKENQSATSTSLNGSTKTSHMNVANHVEAIQQTSRLLEQFHEGKPSIGAIDKQGSASSTVSGARESVAGANASVRAGTNVNASASASASLGQPSVLQAATLFLNDVVQPQLVSKMQLQQVYTDDNATISSPASSRKTLPKLGEGPFSAGTVPASVQFIHSLLVRNASQEAASTIDAMPTYRGSDKKVDHEAEASKSRGFLAANQVPVAINASRIASTVPFAMHATTSLNAGAEARRGGLNSPRVWRKPQGQEQARMDAQVQAQEQARMQEQLDMHMLERERVRAREQELQVQQQELQRQEQEEEWAKEQERVRAQESVLNQHAAQLQEQLQILQERVVTQGDEAWQGSGQEQGIVQEQRLVLEQQVAQEQERTREQQVAQEQERTRAQQVAQEQERTREQQVAQEQERTRAQQVAQEQERTRAQQVAQEQERTREQQIAQEQERTREQQVAQEQDRTREQQVAQEQERTREQQSVQEQERTREQQVAQEQVRTREQQSVQEQERTREQQVTQEQERMQKQEKAQDLVQSEVLQQGNLRPGQVVDQATDDPAVSQRNDELRQAGAISNDGDKVRAASPTMRTAGKMEQSSVMEHVVQPVASRVSGQRIPAVSSHENASRASKLIYRKPSIMENGVEAAMKIQSNDQLLQQLLQKQRQQSSNDPLVGSTYTNTAMTMPQPRMLRGESSQRRLSDRSSEAGTSALQGSPYGMKQAENRQPISLQSPIGRQMEGIRAGLQASSVVHNAQRVFRSIAKSENQAGGGRPEAGNILSSVQGVHQPSNITSEISTNIARKAGNDVANLVPASPFNGYRASLKASARLQEAERIFRSPASKERSGFNYEHQVASQQVDRDADVVQSTLPTADLASEISAKVAESSIAKIGSIFTVMEAMNSENRPSSRMVSEDTERSAEGARGDRERGSNSFGRMVQRIFRKPAEQLPDSEVPQEQARRSQLTVDASEKGSSNWIQSSLSTGNFAAEIASKITENSLKSMGPTLAPAAAEIGMLRNKQADAVLRKQLPVSAVQAIWRHREGPSSLGRRMESESINRTVDAKEVIRSATTASEPSSGIAQSKPVRIANGIATSVPMVGRMTKAPAGEGASARPGEGRTLNSSLIDTSRSIEVHRLMEAEARAKLQLQAGRAMQSRKQPAMGPRRGAQVEHIQRQSIAVESERALRASSGSLNQSEAGSFLPDSAERTIKVLSALEAARAQDEPAAASRAAARADARTTRASMARQPASMTPRVMPLLASTAGARSAAPAGSAAASPAAAVNLLPAYGTGSFTQAAAIGRAATTHAGHSTSMSQSALPPNLGSGITSARQEHLASQLPTLEHKQAPAAPVPNSALADAPLEMDWLRTKASADEAKTPAAPVPQAPPELTSEQLQEIMKQIPQLDVAKIADKVFREIEKRMKFEQQRRGF
ncbi:hypothetical protein GQF01_17760 [Paenibacillus sp. 5J-6]|uniref:Uncharacterized protein n=1 Tax=Paenibacillus silvestris TaxID=2606219 RepID=A0A6L8V2R3_9BACL|nr:hypothetical protein [Paenibacillus silvestris]MZQ83962.1 hypothetical protein [Paenibacillus silvestris]